jgi:hypothetical protein
VEQAVGVPRIWNRLMVTGIGLSEPGSSTPIGIVNQYSWMKTFERNRRHGVVILEHGMQPDHLQSRITEQTMHLLRLRRAVSHAAGAEHLEGVNEHRLAA